jgi:hypothetical protein
LNVHVPCTLAIGIDRDDNHAFEGYLFAIRLFALFDVFDGGRNRGPQIWGYAFVWGRGGPTVIATARKKRSGQKPS